MTTKERALLRSAAMTMPATVQIGKNGITETLAAQISEQLDARELVKISVLRNADAGAKEFASDAAASVGAEVVQVIGSKITLYRRSEREGVTHLL